jgi:hypothetical protein
LLKCLILIIYYKQGSNTPYKSVKFGGVKFISLSLGFSDNGQNGNGVQTESFTISFNLFGYKDWINNQSYSFNFMTSKVGAY